MKVKILIILSGILWPVFSQAQEVSKENEFSMSAQIRPRAEYRNGVLFQEPNMPNRLLLLITGHVYLWNINGMI